MSAAPRTQQQRSLATKARLLHATIECVVERGYAGASTTEICKLARVSRGAQLHHYPTKAELVAAAVERLFDTRHAEFRDRLSDIGDREHRLDAAIDALWEIYRGATLGAWMELVVASRTDPALRAHVKAVDERFFVEARETFNRLFAVDLPPRRAAAATRLLTSVFDGLALHHVLEPDPEAIEDVLSAFKLLIRSFVS